MVSLHHTLAGVYENDMTLVREFNGYYNCGDELSQAFASPRWETYDMFE